MTPESIAARFGGTVEQARANKRRCLLEMRAEYTKHEQRAPNGKLRGYTLPVRAALLEQWEADALVEGFADNTQEVV